LGQLGIDQPTLPDTVDGRLFKQRRKMHMNGDTVLL
jgi:hypothetical protein